MNNIVSRVDKPYLSFPFEIYNRLTEGRPTGNVFFTIYL